jgi:pimeloyl-ACP methyl ester carboxylesterase
VEAGSHTVDLELAMERLKTPDGIVVSYDQGGSGPALVLVHGGFSDHDTNWTFVKPRLRERFTVYAIARRGRGDTSVTEGHTLEDEIRDTAAAIEAVGDQVFLLGHSYGAHCALGAAALLPDRIRSLILYEPAWPQVCAPGLLARLEALAAERSWDAFAMTFFHVGLRVPLQELEALRTTGHWPPIIADARASLGDLRAIARYKFDASPFRTLDVPVLLQIGSESPRELYVTDALAAVLPNARIEVLPGQAHEAMTTAPDLYVDAVTAFMLTSTARPEVAAP